MSIENFQKLLNWLDSDAQRSAEKYEHIQKALTKIFLTSGFDNPEELADETIDRVAGQIKNLKDYEGEKIKYFVGVARFIKKENYRQKDNFEEIEEIETMVDERDFYDEDTANMQLERLKKCLKRLTAKDRKMVLSYYNVANSGKKTDHHKNLAEKYSLSANTLRVQVFRVKQKLSECLDIKAKKGD